MPLLGRLELTLFIKLFHDFWNWVEPCLQIHFDNSVLINILSKCLNLFYTCLSILYIEFHIFLVWFSLNLLFLNLSPKSCKNFTSGWLKVRGKWWSDDLAKEIHIMLILYLECLICLNMHEEATFDIFYDSRGRMFLSSKDFD